MASDMILFYTPDPNVGLFGGRWLPDKRGVLRWHQQRDPKALDEVEIGDRYAFCGTCGTEFAVSTASVRYCSDRCREIGYKARKNRSVRSRKKPCPHCGKPMDRKASRCQACWVQARMPDGKWLSKAAS